MEILKPIDSISLLSVEDSNEIPWKRSRKLEKFLFNLEYFRLIFIYFSSSFLYLATSLSVLSFKSLADCLTAFSISSTSFESLLDVVDDDDEFPFFGLNKNEM